MRRPPRRKHHPETTTVQEPSHVRPSLHDRLAEETRLIPESHLPEIFDIVHRFRIGHETAPTATHPARQRQRYSLAELLEGTTPEAMAELNEATAWAREGEPVGRELG